MVSDGHWPGSGHVTPRGQRASITILTAKSDGCQEAVKRLSLINRSSPKSALHQYPQADPSPTYHLQSPHKQILLQHIMFSYPTSKFQPHISCRFPPQADPSPTSRSQSHKQIPAPQADPSPTSRSQPHHHIRGF